MRIIESSLNNFKMHHSYLCRQWAEPFAKQVLTEQAHWTRTDWASYSAQLNQGWSYSASFAIVWTPWAAMLFGDNIFVVCCVFLGILVVFGVLIFCFWVQVCLCAARCLQELRRALGSRHKARQRLQRCLAHKPFRRSIGLESDLRLGLAGNGTF